MTVSLNNVCKTYYSNVVINNLSFKFDKGIYGISGHNGSGKSTLLGLISGYIDASKGSISYEDSEGKIQDINKQVSIAAPYLELPKYLTIYKFLEFHFSFKKKILDDIDFGKILKNIDLNKKIDELSSGMYQKLKLAMALYSDSKILLLDEPTENLDTENKKWFYDMPIELFSYRITIIASNNQNDFVNCRETLDITKYK